MKRKNQVQKIISQGNDTKKPASDRAFDGKTRNCLLCLTRFFSVWAGQRICEGCKSTAAWRGGALK